MDQESIARIIDKFVDGLSLENVSFKKAEAASAAESRPLYDPGCLLKLYLYGSRKKLRSSRKLEEACHLNLEAKWLMSGIELDFRMISGKIMQSALRKYSMSSTENWWKYSQRDLFQ